MADTKVFSDGNVNIWWVPAGGFADYRAPTATEINAGVALSPAVSWQDYDLGNSASGEEDDRSILDPGNATTRGLAEFSATLSFFRPFNDDINDPTSDYAKAFQAFRTPRVSGYLVVRLLQNERGKHSPAVEGDQVSVYKFIADTFVDDTEGDDSVKFTVNFLPQGDLAVNTFVKTSETIAVDKATITIEEGGKDIFKATLGDWNVTRLARLRSDNPEVATVTPNGVVVGQSEGEAEITVSHPSADGDATVTVTVGN